MVKAKASSSTSRLEGLRQELVTGEFSHDKDTQIHQSLEVRGDRSLDSRQEAAMVESHRNTQDLGHRDVHQQGTHFGHSQHRIDNSSKATEISQQNQQIENPNTRTPVSRAATVNSTHNRQSAGNPSELPKNQGIPIITSTNYDNQVQESGRLIEEPARIGRETGHDASRYQANFPKITSNFDRNVNRNVTKKDDHPINNPNSFPKKDQIPEPAPYTVIQTYADRLRYNQSKRGVSIKL